MRTRFILDANVLIDFCRTDATLLASFNRHVGRVHVASPVLAKVDQLDADGADRLGLVVVEPPLELAMEAASRAQRSPLAFDDWICLLMGKAQGWTCVTNDKRLRRECAAAKVDVLWGVRISHAPVEMLGAVAVLAQGDLADAKIAQDRGTLLPASPSSHPPCNSLPLRDTPAPPGRLICSQLAGSTGKRRCRRRATPEADPCGQPDTGGWPLDPLARPR